MSAIAYTQLKKRFNEVIEAALESGETIHVTRADGRDFAIVPDTTAMLLQEPNKTVLMESIEQAKRGEFGDLTL